MEETRTILEEFSNLYGDQIRSIYAELGQIVFIFGIFIFCYFIQVAVTAISTYNSLKKINKRVSKIESVIDEINDKEKNIKEAVFTAAKYIGLYREK